MGLDSFFWEQNAEKLELTSYLAGRTWAEKWLSGGLCVLQFSIWVVAVFLISKNSLSVFLTVTDALFIDIKIQKDMFFLKGAEEDEQPSQLNPVSGQSHLGLCPVWGNVTFPSLLRAALCFLKRTVCLRVFPSPSAPVHQGQLEDSVMSAQELQKPVPVTREAITTGHILLTNAQNEFR